MSTSRELVRRACETYEAYFALGNECVYERHLRFVRNREARSVYDANHAALVSASTPEEIEQALARSAEIFEDFDHLCFHVGPFTPPAFEARLCLDGYEEDPTLQMLLEGELQAEARNVEIRPASSDADWEVIRRLTRLDHDEQASLQGRAPYSQELAGAVTRVRRAKQPALRFWLAHHDGADCGFFSSLPGENGVGMVEDLFTHPGFRRQGIATALMARAVEDARERGAGPILIGARPDDTPRQLYARLGFRPLCVTRSYLDDGKRR
jgi:GNAT superfamily N-acetyltransferase